jgi:hypothetical protein
MVTMPKRLPDEREAIEGAAAAAANAAGLLGDADLLAGAGRRHRGGPGRAQPGGNAT